MIFFRKLHKWLGLIVGIQVLIWVGTGAIISLIDTQAVGGGFSRNGIGQDAPLSRYGTIVPIARLPDCPIACYR